MNHPIITVVIPTYNYANFIPRAIHSVLNQTHQPLEIVVVDDGSTDHTPDVLREFGDRIKCITLRNQGAANARNAAISQCTSEYIALLDADDFWHPDKIERQLALLSERPEVDVVGCGVRLVDGELLNPQEVTFPINYGDRIASLRAVGSGRALVGGSMSGALMRRSLFDRVGLFDARFRASEDREFWFRVANSAQYSNLSEVLVTCVEHGTGHTSDVPYWEKNAWMLYETATTNWPEVFGVKFQRKWRAWLYADAAICYREFGDIPTARKRFIKSLTEWPFHSRRWYALLRTLHSQRRPTIPALGS